MLGAARQPLVHLAHTLTALVRLLAHERHEVSERVVAVHLVAVLWHIVVAIWRTRTVLVTLLLLLVRILLKSLFLLFVLIVLGVSWGILVDVTRGRRTVLVEYCSGAHRLAAEVLVLLQQHVVGARLIHRDQTRGGQRRVALYGQRIVTWVRGDLFARSQYH